MSQICRTNRFWTVRAIVFVIATVLVFGHSSIRAQEGQEGHNNLEVPKVETYIVPVDGPNVTGAIPPLDLSLTQLSSGEVEVIRPTEAYIVPVDGPNRTGEIPPLDKSKAIPLHLQDNAATQGVTSQSFVPGQWYDHYAYYPLDGTEVEQYTNFQETTIGQYIAFQRWRNNNGGANRFMYDGWTGSTHNWFNTWLNYSPSLSPSAEYAEGYGTRLQTYFKTNSGSCPCWLSDYRVGDH